MKANITPKLGDPVYYRVDWLNDDGTVNEGHDKDTLAECLEWCRSNDIGWVRLVGFSDELIELEEFRCLNKGAENTEGKS